MNATLARRTLILALLSLAMLYAAWLMPRAHPWAALAVFVLPPALLAWSRWRGHPRAGFWAGVLALGWFSHGVMVAWTRPFERGYALVEILLALVVVFTASLPGLHARFSKKRG